MNDGKPPRRRLTVRALAAVIALFALDFGGWAWVIRHRPIDPLLGLISPIVFWAPVVLFFVLIYLYLPRRLGEILTVILILIVLVLLLVPVLRH